MSANNASTTFAKGCAQTSASVLDSVQLAQLGITMDKLRLLNRTARDAARWNDLQFRISEADARNRLPNMQPGLGGVEDGMNVYFNSPITVQPASATTDSQASPPPLPATSPTVPSAGLSALAKTLISAALVGAGAAGGVGIPWLAGALSRPSAPASIPATTQTTTVVQPAQPAVTTPQATPTIANEYQLKMVQ